MSSHLQGVRATDWAATALFYAALHYVDSYFATVHIHPRDHAVRSHLVAVTTGTRPLYPHYQELLQRSIDARYNGMRFPDAFVDLLRRQHLQPIKDAIGQLTGSP